MSSVSWQARGLTKHEAIFIEKIWSKQAWLQPIHVLISSLRPCSAFCTKKASANIGRAIDTISACPAAKTCSAISGVLIRFEVISGTLTKPFNFSVTHVKAARGTLVAMVGMRASCHPIPVLMMVAPAFSIACANCTTSSKLEPPSTKSSIDKR